jgi:hypothetical protein
VSGLLHAPAVLSPRYPLNRRRDGPQSRSGQREEEKTLDPTGNRTPTPLSSSSVASRYTDRAIAVHQVESSGRKLFIILRVIFHYGPVTIRYERSFVVCFLFIYYMKTTLMEWKLWRRLFPMDAMLPWLQIKIPLSCILHQNFLKQILMHSINPYLRNGINRSSSRDAVLRWWRSGSLRIASMC